MDYIDGFIAAIPTDNKQSYIQYARDMSLIFQEYGATRLVECWEDDVPDGELTSFPMAVKRKPGESIVFSWIAWPSREARNDAWKKLMEDPRMSEESNPMPFDGMRMVFGGFQMIVDL